MTGKTPMTRLLAVCLLTAGLLTQLVAADVPPLRLDGEFDDWPPGVSMQADAHYVYLSLDFPERVSLQTATLATRILLDVDASSDTGAAVHDGAQQLLLDGVDLVIEFAPVHTRNQQGLGGGAALYVSDASGTLRRLPHQAAGFAALPTYASDRFELRLPRYQFDNEPVAAMLRLDADEQVVCETVTRITLGALPFCLGLLML